jgi:hypothetical protein
MLHHAKLTLLLSCLFISLNTKAQDAGVFNQDNYEEIKASGKTEYLLCGFNANKATMKEIMEKLGDPTSKTQDPEGKEPNFYVFSWSKGPLKININTYLIPEFPNTRPVSIEVEGSDPDHFCLTGRGLALGDSADKAVKLYAKKYHKIAPPKDHKLLAFMWGDIEGGGLSATISKTGVVSTLEATGEN